MGKTLKVYRASFGTQMGWSFNGFCGETVEEALEEARLNGAEISESDVYNARLVDLNTGEVVRK